MSGPFAGKVVLITGGASGIGRVTCLAFAQEGARVVVSDLAPDAGEETVRMVTKAGAQASFVRADVTRAADVKALVAEIARSCGKLDFAINNAGVDGVAARTADYPEEIWHQVVAVNLTGVFLCMKYEIPLMLEHGGGAIINTASVAAVTGFVNHSAYTASKHGVIGLTKTAALEYAKAGLRINAVCPCYTRTPMLDRVVQSQPGLEGKLLSRVPMGKLATPEEVAAAAIYLCSDKAAFITGHSLFLDGGIMAE